MNAEFERRTLEELLATAESRISRLSPAEAHSAMENGALLIDIRSDSSRARDGIVPGSIHIPRTVLEWRTAPESEFRNPYLGDVDQQLIVLCDHGCSSVLAAGVLSAFGFVRVGDVIGGFSDWRDASLPVSTVRRRRSRPVGNGMGGGRSGWKVKSREGNNLSGGVGVRPGAGDRGDR